MKRTGFTLIELLVVIAIIAMLVGILVPVLRAAKQQGRAVACGSNLKQLTLALNLYEQENKTFPYGFDDSTVGVIKPPGGYVGDASDDQRGLWWFQFLPEFQKKNFFEKATILRCPSRFIKDLGPKENILCGNYGVNQGICKYAGSEDSELTGRSLGLSQIRFPARTLLITDSGYSLISWRGVTNASVQPFENKLREGAVYIPGLWINKERTICTGHEQDAMDGRHPNKTVNVGFADGHLDYIKADNLFVKESDGNYRNRSPLWLPK